MVAIQIKLSGITWYHWQITWDLSQNYSWVFESSNVETNIVLTNLTWNKTINYSVYFEDELISSTNYQITLIQEELWNNPTPGTETWSISCSWSSPLDPIIFTGDGTVFTLTCSGSSEITWNISNSDFIINDYSGGLVDLASSSNSSTTKTTTITFKAWNQTWNASLTFKENTICLSDDPSVCNTNITSSSVTISWVDNSGGDNPTPGTETWSISCSLSWPSRETISTGEQARFTLTCSGSSEITWNISNSSFTISGYNGGSLDVNVNTTLNRRKRAIITFTAWDETWTAVIIFRENIVCLSDDPSICNDSMTFNSVTISWVDNSGWNWGGNNGSWNGGETETWVAPVVEITLQPSTEWTQSKTITASSSNYSWFQYIVTSSTSCNSGTSFSSASNYTSTLTFSSESDNNKYVCFRARNNFWTWYARSNKIENIDKTSPVCTRWTPSKLELHVWETGSITLTCIDSWAGITENSLGNSLFIQQPILILNNWTVGWNSANKTFLFIYSATETWNTKILLLRDKVHDNAWNKNTFNSYSEAITVLLDDGPWNNESWHNAPSCERLIQFNQTPYSSWTQSNTVDVELFCWSTWRWAFSTTNVWVDIRDGTEFENGHLLLTTTWESFNGQYVCVYAQTWERVETGCTNYPFKVDAFDPEVDLISPNNWASFESWDSITLSRSWSDLTSWISWYLLEISKPNGTNIIKQFSENTTSTWIIVDVAWRWYRSVSAYDKADRSKTQTRFFNSTYSGNNYTWGNNTWGNNTGSNETWADLTWFYLISPALFLYFHLRAYLL